MKPLADALLATLAVAAAATLMPPAALADNDHCRSDKEGEARVPGTGSYAMRAARRAAIADWKHRVHEKYGVNARWQDAVERRVHCEADDGSTECEVEARPCPPPA